MLSWTFLGVAAGARLCAPLDAQQPDAHELNRQAVQAISARQYSKAIEQLRRAQKLAPADLTVAFNLGLAYFRAGRYGDAIAPLKRALSDPLSRDKARFLLGTSYYQTENFQKAAEALEPLRADPAYAENALYLLEESYRKAHNESKAEEAFADLLRRYPDSALVHKLLGVAYDAQGRPQEALSELEKAAERDPALPEISFTIGLLHLKLHDDQTARVWFEKELALNSCSAASLYYLGEIDRAATQLAAAAGSYRKALICQPSYGEAYFALGIAMQGEGKERDAVPILRRAVELMPEKSEAHFQLARSLAKIGLAAEASRELRKARELASAQEPKDVSK